MFCWLIGNSETSDWQPKLQSEKPFSTPLFYYNTDILKYLQILYNHQRIEDMSAFFTGPLVPQDKRLLSKQLEAVQFGYALQRKGVKNPAKGEWLLTYSRVIMGTNEAFTIRCLTVNDTCKLYLDQKTWTTLFDRIK